MLFRICENHNLHLQADPTYGGRGYLEKQDFIVEKQKEKIPVRKEILTRTDKAIEEQEKKIQKAEKACEVVTDTVRGETQKEDIKIVDDYSKWLSASDTSEKERVNQNQPIM